ncbi:hypothetical protein V6N11_040107 [Hibiscus sabdariffa]|uniref:Uncharacterized protein n=1 Tax=Hibiscus sabdariffa TaxID=183260 RepID=A0ABR2RH42_9ROSI
MSKTWAELTPESLTKLRKNEICVSRSLRFLEADPKLSFEALVYDFRLKNRRFRQFSIPFKGILHFF